MGNDDFNFGYNDPDYSTDDPPTYAGACMGMLVCPHCGRSAMCSDIDINLVITNTGDNTHMTIPRNSGRDDTAQGGRRTRKGSGLRYLSADMLTATHQLATIVAARVQPDSFRKNQDCVVVKLKFKGEFLLWTLREGNPNLDVMGDAMGDDESRWKDREIELYIEQDDFDGKKWIRAEVIATPRTETKKR